MDDVWMFTIFKILFKFKVIMENSTNIKHNIINATLSSQPTRKTIKQKYEKKKCSECNKIRKPSSESNQICFTCDKVKKRIILSGNEIIDDFIRYTQINCPNKSYGKMLFVPYEEFKNIKPIGEGGFSKVYKATWIDCQITDWGTLDYTIKKYNRTIALKRLNNSKNITSKELNEVNIPY
jgi:hypothetical protein